MTVRILNCDVLDGLRQLPDESVHCCVTSPPYWGLRDYGVDGQIGLEATPEAFVARLVEVFREVRRVLRKDGTCWVNLGDSYCNTDKWGGGGPNTGKQTVAAGGDVPSWAVRAKKDPGLKPKDLIGIPWRVAFALQADGWWLRSDIIWAKPNPMPESVTDRPTKSHEYVFLLAKSERYHYDADAIREDRTGDEDANTFRGGSYVEGAPGPRTVVGNKRVKIPGGWDRGDGAHGTIHRDGRTSAEYQEADVKAGRNKRTVWTVATAPFSEAHFATFPPDLIEPMIKAGTSEHGCCAKCGAPWVRETERIDKGFDGSKYGERAVAASGGAKTGGTAKSTLGSNNGKQTGHRETMGWRPSCPCNADVVACTVLDPFSGAGTTCLVADRLQRNAIGIELNSEYAAMSERRIRGDAGMFAEIGTVQLSLMEAAE